MAWNVDLHLQFPIVVLTYSGEIAPADLEASFASTITLCESSKCFLILADCLQMTGGHSLTDVYMTASALANQEDLHHFREALILPEAQAMDELPRFWETVSNNHGLSAKTFTGRQEAIDWLMAPAAE